MRGDVAAVYETYRAQLESAGFIADFETVTDGSATGQFKNDTYEVTFSGFDGGSASLTVGPRMD